MQEHFKYNDPLKNTPDNMDKIIDYVVQMNMISVNQIRYYFNLTQDEAFSAMLYLIFHDYVECLDGVTGKWKVLPEVKKTKSE